MTATPPKPSLEPLAVILTGTDILLIWAALYDLTKNRPETREQATELYERVCLNVLKTGRIKFVPNEPAGLSDETAPKEK